jgi:hypothetical protein
MAEMSELARRIVKRVAELPDRSSPDDWPEAMLVTGDELAEIIDEEVAEVINVEGDGLTQGERLVNAAQPRKSLWNPETRTVKLPPPGDEDDHTKALVAFLEKIGGSGYGGMAEYEIALGEARRVARYTVFGPDVTKEEIVMTGEDGLTESERRVVNACRTAIREELQRANRQTIAR